MLFNKPWGPEGHIGLKSGVDNDVYKACAEPSLRLHYKGGSRLPCKILRVRLIRVVRVGDLGKWGRIAATLVAECEITKVSNYDSRRAKFLLRSAIPRRGDRVGMRSIIDLHVMSVDRRINFGAIALFG